MIQNVAVGAHDPQVSGLGTQHRPLAHCQSLLQDPPIGVVPPWGRQAGTATRCRKSVQLIAATPSPHCWTSAGVAPVCGAASASWHGGKKNDTQSAMLVYPLSGKSPGAHACMRSQYFVMEPSQAVPLPPALPPPPPVPPPPPPLPPPPPSAPVAEQPPSKTPTRPTAVHTDHAHRFMRRNGIAGREDLTRASRGQTAA
jgi:hypothetical protein